MEEPLEARDPRPGADHWAAERSARSRADYTNEQGHDGECPYPCPICAGVGMLRQFSPEIGEHLATAAKELMLAAKAFLDSVAEGGSKKESEPVERIPFD